MLASLNTREKGLVFATLGVILLSLIYGFGLKPAGLKWAGLNRQVLNKEIALRRNIKFIRQKQEISNIYGQYSGLIKKRATDEEEMADLLNIVENIATDTNIRIANIRPKPTKRSEFYKKYVLEMNCQAAIEDYIEFIYNLQKSGQSVRVEKLKLTSQGRDTPLLKARMLITKVLTSN